MASDLLPITFEDLEDRTSEEINELILEEYTKLEQQILSLKEDENLGRRLKSLMLQIIDSNWIQHLDVMTLIKDGIHLHSYGQEDPNRVFESDALAEFNQLLFDIESGVSIRFIEYIKSQYEMEQGGNE